MLHAALALVSRHAFAVALLAGLSFAVDAAHASPERVVPEARKRSASVAAATNAEERFELTVVAPTGVKKDQPAKATVKMVPKGEWHMNMEFPTSLTLTAAETVRLTKAKLRAADAKTLDEQKGAEFEVEFTPTQAGRGEVAAKLKFAICIESACAPVTEERTIAFEAK